MIHIQRLNKTNYTYMICIKLSDKKYEARITYDLYTTQRKQIHRAYILYTTQLHKTTLVYDIYKIQTTQNTKYTQHVIYIQHNYTKKVHTPYNPHTT